MFNIVNDLYVEYFVWWDCSTRGMLHYLQLAGEYIESTGPRNMFPSELSFLGEGTNFLYHRAYFDIFE